MADGGEFDNTNTNVIYITEEHRVEWNYDATKELLKLYDEKCDMLESGIINTQKKLWELVSKDMIRKGYYYTGPQCENKWKTLKRTYRNKMDKAEKFGTCKRSCPFEDEITEILSKRPQESFTRSFYTPKHIKSRNDETLEINLNNPPGFSGENDSYQDIKNVKLIHNNDSMDGQMLENTEYIIQDASQNQILEELSELRKIVSKHYKMGTEYMKQSNELHSKIVHHLDGAKERECQSLEFEETRIEQQNEVIKQMKIQNSLLQKLLERLG
ncbi:uncharacterized protein [Leptinotarsa decemlineata]|uniref:uncharacterized protein n=1 Tax=Leptinotarsa decemlineata TaxID=7539 RepID=UPI003D30D326